MARRSRRRRNEIWERGLRFNELVAARKWMETATPDAELYDEGSDTLIRYFTLPTSRAENPSLGEQ